ncbi:MAG: hypothetical protein DRN81_05490 [Thermoproteota archaeon]|nr:MAG: hypothetical protein DRN81_05490 [Candidatus Korarchaeota archaeon]
MMQLVSSVNSVVATRGGLFKEKQYWLLKRLSMIFGFTLAALLFLTMPIVGILGSLLFGEGFGLTGELLSIMSVGAAASVLYYYPKTKLLYHSPKGFCAMQFSYALSSIVFALFAPNIRMATILSVVAAYIHTVVGWVLADFVKLVE